MQTSTPLPAECGRLLPPLEIRHLPPLLLLLWFQAILLHYSNCCHLVSVFRFFGFLGEIINTFLRYGRHSQLQPNLPPGLNQFSVKITKFYIKSDFFTFSTNFQPIFNQFSTNFQLFLKYWTNIEPISNQF